MSNSYSKESRVLDRRRWEAIRARLRNSLTSRFYLRVHMALILACTWVTGVTAAWIMKRLGLSDLSARYLIAVSAAYFAFVIGVTLWVYYLRSRRSEHGEIDADLAELVPNRRSGGAGEETETVTSESGSVLDLAALDIEGLAVAVVLVLAVVVAVGGGIYLIWEAPSIAAEGLLELVLATGLLRVRGVEPSGGVFPFVIKRTWWIAVVAIVAALGFAYFGKVG